MHGLSHELDLLYFSYSSIGGQGVLDHDTLPWNCLNYFIFVNSLHTELPRAKTMYSKYFHKCLDRTFLIAFYYKHFSSKRHERTIKMKSFVAVYLEFRIYNPF